MSGLREYRTADTPRLVEAWNTCFAGGPNYVRVREEDFRARVLHQPGFDRRGVLVAGDGDGLAGFVHFGPRLEWDGATSWGARSHEEGHIYAVAAPEADRLLIGDLIAAAEQRLGAAGARRVLLGPSWVYGVQPLYNGIAGGYEIPGLSAVRRNAVAVAQERGYTLAAEYGTPELDLSGPEPLGHLAEVAAELRARAREWRLGLHRRVIEERYFPARTLVELSRGGETVATTAYGVWPEYLRHYRRRLYGITTVQVAAGWRGRGLGKLIMIEAMEAAAREGAEAVHLHVWRGNEAAWRLYHRALGFQPRHNWITLEKVLG
ncbi:MAG: GNAT family N-acetyltransferase [Armatimonadota bacterium]